MNKKKDPTKLKIRKDFTLSPEAAARLDQTADTTGLSRSQIIERLINQYLTEARLESIRYTLKAIEKEPLIPTSDNRYEDNKNSIGEPMKPVTPKYIPFEPKLWKSQSALMQQLIDKGIEPQRAAIKAHEWYLKLLRNKRLF